MGFGHRLQAQLAHAAHCVPCQDGGGTAGLLAGGSQALRWGRRRTRAAEPRTARARPGAESARPARKSRPGSRESRFCAVTACQDGMIRSLAPQTSMVGMVAAIGRWSHAVTVCPPGSMTERTVARNARRPSASELAQATPRLAQIGAGLHSQALQAAGDRGGALVQPARGEYRQHQLGAGQRGRPQQQAQLASQPAAADQHQPASPVQETGRRTASRCHHRASARPASPARSRAGRAGHARSRRASRGNSPRPAWPRRHDRTGPARPTGARLPARASAAPSVGASPAGRARTAPRDRRRRRRS